jgi:hypothetical protein
MPTPLQERAYELLIRVTTVDVDTCDDGRVETIAMNLFSAAVELGTNLEVATSAPDRQTFRAALAVVNSQVKMVKLWLRVLDDLGRIAPEVASPLHDAAEEVHRLVITALRTSATSEPRLMAAS